MTAVDEIKARLSITELVESSGVKLRRSGRTMTGFCPFHSNTRTPAFVVWPETGTWRCFGECNEGGDIFKFYMKKENVDFKEAVKQLAERTGVKLSQFSERDERSKEEFGYLRGILDEASLFFRHQLTQTDSGKPALKYLIEKRNLTRETIERFGLGYAPNDWSTLLRYFEEKNISTEDLLTVGLVNERESGGYYDKFRNRVMIPILDENGKMTGFGARILDPNDLPKFMNSPQTPVFDKSSLLFGMDQAKRSIRGQDQAVIVEGYLDVIALHQAGFTNVVSPMGTAITESQMRQVKKYTKRVVLALDPDSAGQKAVFRGLESAREAMSEEETNVFDPRGLLKHESRLNADIRVANMPEGLDPDEVVEQNPELWKTLVSNAKPIVEYVFESLIANKNVNDPKEKSAIVSEILPLIEEVQDTIERDTYRQMVARRLRIDEHTMMSIRSATPAKRRTWRETNSRKNRQVQENALIVNTTNKQFELLCLNILLRNPELLPKVDRTLQQANLSGISPDDFMDTQIQILLRLLKSSFEQDESDQAHYVLSRLDETTRDVYEEVMMVKPVEGTADRLISEIVRVVIQIRQLRLREYMTMITMQMDDPESENDLSLLGKRLKKISTELLSLDRARKSLIEIRRS